MLEISESAKDRLEETVTYSHMIGRYEQFEKMLLYLHLYGCTWMNPFLVKTLLYRDFSQYSFTFAMFRLLKTEDGDPHKIFDGKHTYEERPFMNGGLIFHDGRGINDGSLSVEIASEEGPHWSVHT